VGGLAGCDRYDDAGGQLDGGSQRGLIRVELEEGDYELVLAVTGVPVGNHTWRAKVSGELVGDRGRQQFSGSPKRYLDRQTDGDGVTYWSDLVIHRFTVDEASFWRVDVNACDLELPDGAIAILRVDRGSMFGGAPMPVFVSVGMAVAVGVSVLRRSGQGYSSRRGGSDSIFFGGDSSCGGGGCGGGCGGCS
jgi:hypothetical protein